VGELEGKMSSLNTKNANFTSLAEIVKKGNGASEQEKRDHVTVMNSISVEIKEQQKKKSNVVVFNLKQSESAEAYDRTHYDHQEVASILKYLRLDDRVVVEKIVRYRPSKTGDKVPPLVFTLEDEKQRNLVLFAAKQLRNNEKWSRTFLSADLTLAERMQFKELRVLRDQKQKEEKSEEFRWVIRDGKVVRMRKTLQ
jgi:hypothetical protein